MSTVASRTPMLRVVVAVLVLGFATMGLWGGLLSAPSAEPAVQAFLLDWQQKQYGHAASLTTGDQAVVATALRRAYSGLNAAAFHFSLGPTSQHGDTAQARFEAVVDLGQNGAPWSYQGVMRLRLTGGSQWKIIWSPSVINPHLRHGLRLAVVSSTPQRSEPEDSSGAPLLTPSTVWEVGVRPGRLKHPGVTARELGQVTGLDSAQILGWIRAAPPGRFLELVTLPPSGPSGYAALQGSLGRVPGLTIKKTTMRLFDSIAPAVVGSVQTELSPLLRDQGIAYRPGATVGVSGLQKARQQQLAGTPTTEVVTQTMAGHQVEVLHRWHGQPSRPLRTTLDGATQRAADAAVRAAAAKGSAAIVAVQASTGKILAVADQQAQGLPAVDPLGGQYPPGGAFTIVSTESLLASGLSLNGPVECPATADVGGQSFRGAPPQPPLPAQPQPDFARIFASSCVTAFSTLSQRQTAAAHLAASASAFGLGSRWEVGLPSFSGTVPTGGGVAGLAADFMGQGGVRVSPLAMAVVAAEVDSGLRVRPWLLTSQDPPQTRPFRSPYLSELQALTRDVVRSGAAKRADLRGRQHVHGQVGSVPLGPSAKGVYADWFVGYRGDVAFAALILTRPASGSAAATSSAVALGRAFLAKAPVG